MRVLLLGDLDQPHTRRWASALHCEGVDVLTVGFGEGSGIPGSVESFGNQTGSDVAYLRALPRLARIARAFCGGLVHAHFATSYGVLADVAVRDRPHVVSAWGSDVLMLGDRPAILRRATHGALRRASAVTYDSVDVGSMVRSIAPAARGRLIVFGPDEEWTRIERTDETRVLSPRQLKPLYRIPEIVDAFAAARPALGGWTLDILTYGADATGLEARANDAGIRQHVTFHARLTAPLLRERFARSPIFVSVPQSDGTSVSLLEGMAAGSFPIVSDIPANGMWVRDAENGLIVPVGDVGALAGALIRAAQDVDLRRSAQIHNRALIAEDLTLTHAMSRMLALYNEVLSR